MLYHYVWADFLEVLRDLSDHGFTLRSEWYEAQAEFRFPTLGETEVEGARLELRQALEPWHVLGGDGARSAARCATPTARPSASR